MSVIKLGSKIPTNIKLGSKQVSKIYKGSTLIWDIEDWMEEASESTGIPIGYFSYAYLKYPQIKNTFTGTTHNCFNCDGASYFLTDVIPSSTSKTIVRANSTNTSEQYNILLGSRQSIRSNTYVLMHSIVSNAWVDLYDENLGVDTSALSGIWCKYELDAPNAVGTFSYVQDSETISTQVTFTKTDDYNPGNQMAILAKNGSDKDFPYETDLFKGKISEIWHYENDVLTHLYIPVKDNTLFDIVTCTELTNLGSGTTTYITEEIDV